MDLSNDADSKALSNMSNQIKSKIIDLNKDDGYVDEDDDRTSSNTEKSSNEDGETYDPDNEPVDPRVQIELEKLNKSCSDVNRLENELDELKSLFVTTKNKQAQRLEFLQKKLGNCISKSKPYYDALTIAEKLQIETQKAVLEFQKAISHYKTAKETLSVAEENLSNGGEISDVWQEYLSETITKISQSKKLADQAEDYHRGKAQEYQFAERNLQILEKELRRNIVKSKMYYEEKERWNIQMEAQKARINEIESALLDSKRIYSEAMNKLRDISDEIHLSRRAKLLKLSDTCGKQEKNDTDKAYDRAQEQIESQQIHQTKSLNDIIKAIDGTNEFNASESQSLDTVSLNSNKSNVTEKRSQFAGTRQQNLEYFSFTGIGTGSEPTSRCESPSNFDKTINQTDDNLTPRPVLNDSGKYSCSIDSQLSKEFHKSPELLSNRVKSPQKTQQQQSRLPATPPNNRNKSTQQETPLLANLLLYNNGLMKSQQKPKTLNK